MVGKVLISLLNGMGVADFTTLLAAVILKKKRKSASKNVEISSEYDTTVVGWMGVSKGVGGDGTKNFILTT